MTAHVDASAKTDATRFQSQVARRVADELRSGPSRFRCAKVTSLLHAFRAPGAHIDIGDVKRALHEQGISATSGREEVTRRDVLDLTLDVETGTAARPSDDAGVRMSVWSPGQPRGEECRLPAAQVPDRGSDDVLWFDVDPLTDDPGSESSHQRIDHLTALLQPWCPQLDSLIVRDLLTPDTHPKVEAYGDERTGVRTVSVAAVVARELPDLEDDFDEFDERLIIQMVELIVGPGWIVTCWHPGRSFAGGQGEQSSPPLLREPFLSHVAHRWVHDYVAGPDGDGPRSSSDLGLYLARSVVATYGASLRMLQRWVSRWEVEFYKSLSRNDKPKKLKTAAAEISNFLSMVGEFHRCVSALKLAGEEMPNKSWFAHAPHPDDTSKNRADRDDAAALAASIAAAEQKLTQLAAAVRADMDLLMIQSQATQQEASERLQTHLAKVTGLVLVPTFVAGLFGANTALPGQGSWTGFDIMLALMVVSGIGSYLVIRKLIE